MTTKKSKKKAPEANSSDVHEEIIARASMGMPALPMLDVIFGRMSTGLNAVLKSRAALLAEAEVFPVEYTTWSEAIEGLHEFAVCGIADAKPWDGNVIIAMDPEFFFSAIETQMNGTPKPGCAPGRPASHIERRMARRLFEFILEEVSENFARMIEVNLSLDSVETPHQVSSLHKGNSPCAVVKFSMRVGDCEGSLEMIFPMTTLEPAQPILSKMFLGEKLGGDGTWRDYIMDRISGSSVTVAAQLHEMRVELSDVLAWEPGMSIDLGIGEDHETKVMCSGIPVFYGAVGRRKNDHIALRITKDAGDPLKEDSEVEE
jgi:flagellar motor switch protein FliM